MLWEVRQIQLCPLVWSLCCLWRYRLSYLLPLSLCALWGVSVTQSVLLSPVVVHKVQGRLSKSLLSLWRRLSHPSTESPCVVHTVYSLTQRCPLSHTVVAVAQQTLAELVERDLGQRLSKPLLSW